MVLVHNVQPMKAPERIVRTLVRLDDVELVVQRFEGPSFFGRACFLELVGAVEDWKLVSVVRIDPRLTHREDPQHVKRCSRIVNCVARKSSKLQRWIDVYPYGRIAFRRRECFDGTTR